MTAEALTVGCENCGAVLQIAARERTATCPYCAHPTVVERPVSPDRPVPSFALGFVHGQKDAYNLASRWIRSSSIFARSDFRRAPVETVRGVYLPAYLYGAVAHADYQAQIGEEYTETETYTTTDSSGKTVTRTRTVTRTEWRSLSGQYSSYVRDVIVTASRAIPNDELAAIEPFDLRALRRYDPALISGWTSEEPSLARDECRSLAHQEAVGSVGTALSSFMPGDKHTDLSYRTSVGEEVLDLVLLPLWSFAVKYRDDREPVRILVNGQTGRVGGDVPLSVIKITIAVVVAIAAIAAVFLAVTR